MWCRLCWPCMLLLFLAVPVAYGDGLQKVMPHRAVDFTNSIGVNTHFGYYDTQYGLYDSLLRPRLLELGVKHIRDGTFNEDVARKYRDVGKTGVRLLLITSGKRLPREAEAIGSMLWGVEAVNEPDRSRKTDWVKYARDEQRMLYETAKSDDATRHLQVVGVSLANIRNSPSQLGDMSQWMDYGGMHPYAAGQYPSKHWGWGLTMEAALAETRKVSADKPLIATECGYHNKQNNPNHPGVSELAAAIYHLHMFFIYFSNGIKRCYKYELLDLKPDDRIADMECHFGLVRSDGSVKPSFVAIRNLLRILADNDTVRKCTPLALEVEAPAGVTVRTTLLQKSDGSWWVALLRETEAYDVKQKKDIQVSPVNVCVRTGHKLAARTYIPNKSDMPVAHYDHSDTFTLSVGAEVVLMELRTVKAVRTIKSSP